MPHPHGSIEKEQHESLSSRLIPAVAGCIPNLVRGNQRFNRADKLTVSQQASQQASQQKIVVNTTPGAFDADRTHPETDLPPVESLSKGPDVYIAVMGITGAGKSTLIKHLSEDSNVKIGHSMRSCTQTVDVYECKYTRSDGQTIDVCLLDTPGFDDTDRSDTEVLREISARLGQDYKDNITLSGLIYLHNIEEPRLKGSSRRNLMMFQKLCGSKVFRNVILATTRWESVDETLGNQRVGELLKTEEWWGCMVTRGSRTHRHYNNRQSALDILKLILDREDGDQAPLALDIQKELVDKNRNLDDTSAGQELNRVFTEIQAKHRIDMENLKKDLEEAQKLRDEENEKLIRELQKEKEAEMLKVQQSQQAMKISLDEMQKHVEKNNQLEGQMRENQEKAAKLENQLQNNHREQQKIRNELDQQKLRNELEEKRHRDELEEQKRRHEVEQQRQEQQAIQDRQREQERDKLNAALLGYQKEETALKKRIEAIETQSRLDQQKLRNELEEKKHRDELEEQKRRHEVEQQRQEQQTIQNRQREQERDKLNAALLGYQKEETALKKRIEAIETQSKQREESLAYHNIYTCKQHLRCKWAQKKDKKARTQELAKGGE